MGERRERVLAAALSSHAAGQLEAPSRADPARGAVPAALVGDEAREVLVQLAPRRPRADRAPGRRDRARRLGGACPRRRAAPRGRRVPGNRRAARPPAGSAAARRRAAPAEVLEDGPDGRSELDLDDARPNDGRAERDELGAGARPRAATGEGRSPRTTIQGTAHRVSTLLTAVGRRPRPSCAGYGGRTWAPPRAPSSDAISAVSSPATYDPAPTATSTSKSIPDPWTSRPRCPCARASATAARRASRAAGYSERT